MDRANVRLRSAMKAAGLTYLELATKVGCNLKTAQRWCYEGRVPHLRSAQRVAEVLAVPAQWLWPSLSRNRVGCACGDSAVEITLRLAPGARIAADGGDDPPALWIRTGTVALSIAPRAITESRPLDRDDLNMASDIVMAAGDYRTAILTELTKAGTTFVD